nr:immunoglobulin heavy chain junction region [Macaca mulatta]MOW93395.1 immunoglobulin heavy chain junction region [Macaca mulatta]MOW93853.1 immunoglobulin heavy chain junction region [Macaca mulatta]MOW93861.1 immunoglobulin heavy chain junction region [Macaca mulatta]MOW93935.1 immunoglobulin heavy chain junction region [Macaca mulatta]
CARDNHGFFDFW